MPKNGQMLLGCYSVLRKTSEDNVRHVLGLVKTWFSCVMLIGIAHASVFACDIFGITFVFRCYLQTLKAMFDPFTFVLGRVVFVSAITSMTLSPQYGMLLFVCVNCGDGGSCRWFLSLSLNLVLWFS